MNREALEAVYSKSKRCWLCLFYQSWNHALHTVQTLMQQIQGEGKVFTLFDCFYKRVLDVVILMLAVAGARVVGLVRLTDIRVKRKRPHHWMLYLSCEAVQDHLFQIISPVLVDYEQ